VTLSLITPSLNQLHFLRECAANVRALGPSVQHVVADGGSTDGTVPFLQSLGLAFRSSSDGGMYAGLNAGAQLCTGGIMGYLNCDDLLFPWTAELVEQAFREHPEADLVVGDSLELRGERVAPTIHPPAPLIQQFMRQGGFLTQPSVFFRRRLFDRLGGFSTRYRLLADHDFWLRALASGAQVVRVWEMLAVQRMVPGQLMERHARLAEAERLQIAHEHGVRFSTAARRASALFNRLGMLGLVLPAQAWERCRSGGVVKSTSRRAFVRALLRPSGNLQYLKLAPRGRTLLFPGMAP